MRRFLGILGVCLFLLATPAFAATCNDITVTPDSVVLSESRINRVLTLRIENEGNDSFDLDDVRVEEDDSRIDITVDSFPDEIQENGSGNLVLRYTTQDVNGDQTTSFNVSLRGAFDNTPSCSLADLTFTIDVTIQDSADVCKAISFETTDVSVAEDVTIIHTVFLRNDSSEDFTLQGFNVFDDSPEFSTRLNPGFNDADFIKSIPRHTRQPVRIEIRTQRVSEDVVDHVFLETRGAFSNGQDCSFGDIDGAFEVTVENTFTNVFACTELRVLPAHFDVRAGENNTHSLFLQNNSDQTFHVDHFQIQDVNYQLDYSLLATPQTIRSTKTGEFSLQSTGFRNDVSFDGSAFITIQGHFTDTTACAIPNMRIPFTFHGTQGEQCADFKIILDGGLVKEGQTIPIELINPLTQTARVALTLEDGIIIPSVIAVPPLSHVIHAVRVETNSQVNTLHLQPLIEGCALEGEDRPLFFSSVTQAPIQLNNPPSEIVIGNASTFAIPLMNTSFYSHDATLTLTVKPTGQTFEKIVRVGGFDEPIILLPVSLLQNGSQLILQVASEGYIVTHMYNIVFEEKVRITPEVVEEPVTRNAYTVDVLIQNTTNQSHEGNILITVPTGWKIEGETPIALAPMETKRVTYTISPDAWLMQPRNIPIQFVGFATQSAPHTLILKPSTNSVAQATAFVSGARGFWLGILVLLILAGAWFWIRSRFFPAQAWAPRVTEEEWPDEVWVAPRKK